MSGHYPYNYDPSHPFPPVLPHKPFGLDIAPKRALFTIRPLCTRPRRRVFTARQEGQLTLHGRFFRLDECCGGHEST